jgi:hypothetical protein
MHFLDMRWSDMEWIDLAQDTDYWSALINTVMNVHVPQNAGQLVSRRETDGPSRRAHRPVCVCVSTHRLLL